jgi:uncharacterized protein (TIGR02271 family)
MTDAITVAVYDTAAQADAAVQELEAANIPSNAIRRQPATATSTTVSEPPREQGFWSSLFGGEPDHDTTVYDRSVASGSHVVTVKVLEAQLERVTGILERHNPVDIDERAASYGLGAATTTTTTTTKETLGTRDATVREGEERVQLAEEQINVGKRMVNRGTTRIRRFVVETPVEESVTLHSERVSIERRPVTGDTRATADFTERTIEVTETDEEAVVGKTARVKEEVVIRKDASERVETIHETVRREDVEITKDNTVNPAASRTAGTVTPVRR